MAIQINRISTKREKKGGGYGMGGGGEGLMLESLRKSLEGLGKAMDCLAGTIEQNICKVDDMSFKLRELGGEKLANGEELSKGYVKMGKRSK